MQCRSKVADRDASRLVVGGARTQSDFGLVAARARVRLIAGMIALSAAGCSLDSTPQPGGDLDPAVQSDPNAVVHSSPLRDAGAKTITSVAPGGAGGAAISNGDIPKAGSNGAAGAAPSKAAAAGTGGAPALGGAPAPKQTSDAGAAAGAGGAAGNPAPMPMPPTDDQAGGKGADCARQGDPKNCDGPGMGRGPDGPEGSEGPSDESPGDGKGPRADPSGLIGALIDVTDALPSALISQIGSLSTILLGLSTQVDLTPDVVDAALALLASTNVCTDDQLAAVAPCGEVCDFVAQNCELCRGADCHGTLHDLCGPSPCP